MFAYNQMSLCVTRTTVLNNDRLLGRPPSHLAIIYFAIVGKLLPHVA